MDGHVVKGNAIPGLLETLGCLSGLDLRSAQAVMLKRRFAKMGRAWC